jgi:hypothetical protein
MTADIGPGSIVVCIDDGPDRYGVPVPLSVGAEYEVLAVWHMVDERDYEQGVCLDLVGVPRAAGNLAYIVSRFTQKRDKNQSLIARNPLKEEA